MQSLISTEYEIFVRPYSETTLSYAVQAALAKYGPPPPGYVYAPAPAGEPHLSPT